MWGSRLIGKIIQICTSRCTILHILYTFYREVIMGYHTYRRIKRKTDGAKIFLQYYQGTGDVYLSAAYFKHCEGKTASVENSMFVVNGSNAGEVAALMGIERALVIILSEREAYSLVQLTRFIGQDSVDIKYLHYMSDYPMYTCFLITLAGLHGIGFMDLYQNIVFGGEVFELPTPQWNMGRKLWNPESDRQKKVLLAPAANSIAKGPSILFWRGLVQSLKQMGYRVYTNVSGDEMPIAETEPVFIPYKDLATFLDNSAVFIGYRSGLCDLIAALKCKKIIIYPRNHWPVLNGLNIASTLEIFSLNKMGLCEDAIELEYIEINEPEILSEILDIVTDY